MGHVLALRCVKVAGAVYPRRTGNPMTTPTPTNTCRGRDRAKRAAQFRANFTRQAHYVIDDYDNRGYAVVCSTRWQWQPQRVIYWTAWPAIREVTR